MEVPAQHIATIVISAVLCLIVLLPPSYGITLSLSSPCRLDAIQNSYYYYRHKTGVVIGGLFSVHYPNRVLTKFKDFESQYYCHYPIVNLYAELVSLIMAIGFINKENLLPNISLGYFICDNCGDTSNSVSSILHISSGYKMDVPNYNCDQAEVIGFVGSDIAMAELIWMFSYPQISYRTTDPASNVHNRKSYFNVAHSDSELNAVIYLMKLFDWNWIGIMMSSDDNTELKLQELQQLFTTHEICIAYVIKLTNDPKTNQAQLNLIQRSTATVILVFGKFLIEYEQLVDLDVILQNITIIVHESWMHNFILKKPFRDVLNGSLILRSVTPKISWLLNSLYNITMNDSKNDITLQYIFYFNFGCTNIDPSIKAHLQKFYNFPEKECSDSYKLGHLLMDIDYPSYYYVLTAVHILVNSFNVMLSLEKLRSHGYRYKLQKYIRSLYFKKRTRGKGYNMAREFYHSLSQQWDNGKWAIATKHRKITQTLIAEFGQTLEENNIVESHLHRIIWKQGKVPVSRCSAHCPPGSRKASTNHIHNCCYDCVPCSEGEIANQTDSENCQRCPNEEWPDEKKVKCIPKTFEFLSYQEDILASAIAVISLLGVVITAVVLKVFISFWDTPVVKANNRTVSIILLTSILLSFLCVFLFLGRPVDITCMLRQVSFGIFFTISVSCVLAKTIIVCIAFRITKPDSYWNKWVGNKLANYVVLICSSVQVLSSLIWLSVSRPYQEYDMITYAGKIIIQCNEGSVTCFYTMLGYLGFLAAVSFVLAFMVRTLPDSFNEAKYITFSMLVFCSVWIAMIPAYLSNRGKYMVAVEIFAILTSCAGLLGCIFFPKVYFIVIKPEMNTRLHIKGKI
ncbi:vomeronasal type-2 receptor 26-like [Gastrophryne carolinensis]